MIPAFAQPVSRGPMPAILLTAVFVLGLLEPTTPRAAEPSAASQAIRANAAKGRSPLQRALSADPDAASRYTRLAHPEVAARMDLTDEQRAQVTGLMAQRSTELAAAAEADWPVVMQKHEDLLKAVLTETQQRAWSDLSVQRQLRFNFSATRWEDVLGWFAEQAGLQLVMDAPPPGTFSYSDAKSHTPTESLELLNSVLVTRGFTLVRREQMLMLIDITAPIPHGMLPIVTPEELKDRGRYEIVTVHFDVGRRDIGVIHQEIQPLLGPHAKTLILPATHRLLVTDTVEVQRAVAQVIENIPEPPAPKAQPKPQVQPERTPPAPPVMAIYPIGLVDRDAMLQTLQMLVPSAKFVIDPATSRLNAYATPNQHAAIDVILKEMEAPIPPEFRRTLESYSLDNLDLAPPSGESSAVSSRSSRRSPPDPNAPPPTTGDRFLRTLQAMIPGAQFTLDTTTKRLTAWATTPEHALIRSTLEKLASGPLTENRPRLEVYPLAAADPTEILATFETLMPDVQFSFDAQSASMLAIATSEEHAAIQAALDKLQPNQGGLSSPEVRYYSTTRDPPATLVATLQALVPRGSVEVDVENRRLMVVATPLEHAKVRTAIDDLEASDLEPEERKLTIYPVTPAQRTRFEAVMTTLAAEFPEVKIITDAEPGELSVWATVAEHTTIAGVVAELTKSVPPEDKFQLRFHSIRSVDPTDVLAMLTELHPNTRIVHQPTSRRLMVWTHAAEQEAIAETLSEIEARGPGSDAARFEAYKVRGTASPTFLATLQALAPGATLTVDPASGKLIVWARPDEQTVIKTAIEKLQYGDTPENTPVLKIYRLTRADPTRALSLLATLAPEADLSLDANTGGLIAMAVPKDHETIVATLEQLQPTTPGPDTIELRFHPVKEELSPAVLAILENLVPSAQITVDAAAKRLTVLATEADHATITATLAQIEEAAGAKPELQFYPFEEAPSTTVMTLLASQAPQATITVDAAAGHLVVVATAEDHAMIKATLEQVEAAAPVKGELKFYPLEEPLPASVMTLLTSLAPKAEITVDADANRLIVIAVAADHETIQATLTSVEEAGSNASELKFYPLGRELPASVMTILKSLAPKAQITEDVDGLQLMVLAVPADHAMIKKTLDDSLATLAPEEERKLTVYPIKSADPANVLIMLEEFYPDARIIHDAKTDRLLVWTRQADQASILATLEEIDVERSTEDQPRFAAYPVQVAVGLTAATQAARSAAFLADLQTLVPEARLTIDSESGSLIAFASPKEQAIIKTAVEHLDQGGSPSDTRSKLEIHVLGKNLDSSMTLTLLAGLAPRAELTLDATAGRIIALARPEDHETIRATLTKLQSSVEDPNDPELRFYPLSEPPPATMIVGLQGLAPEAKVTLDANGKHLMVLGTPLEHALIKEAISQLEDAASLTEKPYFESYELAGGANVNVAVRTARNTTVVTNLQTLVPGAKIVLSAGANGLIAFATTSQHADIQTAVAKLSGGDSLETMLGVVVYALTKADPATTLTLMQTLLPEAQLSIDTKTESLVALAVPADQKVIADTLEQLQGTASGAGALELRFYPLAEPPPAGLVEGLAELAPKAQITLAADGKNLMVIASPSEHDVIQANVDKVQQASALRERPRFDSYDLPGLKNAPSSTRYMTGRSFLYTIQSLVPGANLTIDFHTAKLIAWGTSEEHDIIQQAVGQIGLEDEEDVPILQSYPLRKSDPATTLAMLQTLVPNARLAIDAKTDAIVALAIPADQKVIADAIQRLEPEGTDESDPELKVYPLEEPISPTVLGGLQALAPRAEITLDADGKSLTVIAKPSDHAVVQSNLDKLETAAAAKEKNQLIIYPVTSAQRTRLQQILTSLTAELPGIQVITDAEPGSVSIWAKPSQHIVLVGIMTQLTRQESPDQKYRLVGYPLGQADPDSVLSMLEELFPETRFTLDKRGRRLMVYARAAEHEEIAAALLEMNAVGSGGVAIDTFMVYPIPGVNTTTALQILTELVPDARLFADTANETVSAYGRASDHQIITQTLEQFQAGPGGQFKPYLMIYPAGDTDLDVFSQLLDTLVPNAKVVLNTEGRSVAVFAKEADHELVTNAMDSMAITSIGSGKQTLALHTLTEGTAQDAISILTEIVPNAQLSVGSDPAQLVAWGSDSDQKRIEEMLKTIDVEAPDDAKPGIYTVDSGDFRKTYYMTRFLQEAVPNARFNVGSDPAQIVVWATPKDHDTIATLVEQLEKDPPADKLPTMEIHTLESGTAAEAIAILSPIVPDADLSTGSDPARLVVWARASEHTKVRDALVQLAEKGPIESERTFETYTLEEMETTTAIRILENAVPRAELSSGQGDHQLIAHARPSEHVIIAGTLEKIDVQAPDDEKIPNIHIIDSTDPRTTYYIGRFLEHSVPDATFTPGMDPSQLVAWASAEDQAAIAALLEQFEKDPPADKIPTMVIHALELGTAEEAIAILAPIVPDAELSVGSDAGQLVAWARSADQTTIRDALEQLAKKGPAESERTFETYTLEEMATTTAMGILETAVPQAELTVGAGDHQLIAHARPSEHLIIKDTLEKIDIKAPGDEKIPNIHIIDSTDSRRTYYIGRFLQLSVPDATFTPGLDASQLVAWATAEDHQTIATLLEQFEKDPPEDKKRTFETYVLKEMTTNTAISILQQAVPQAQLSSGEGDHQLIANARLSEHEIIKGTLEKIDVEAPDDEKTPAIYIIDSTDGRSTYYIGRFLQQSVPDATFTPGMDPSQLITWATAEDHETIVTLLEQLEKDPPADKIPSMEIYPLESGDALSAITILRPMVPGAELSVGSDAGQLIAWARAEDHEKIVEALGKMEEAGLSENAPTMVIYNLASGDVLSAIQVLTPIVPEADLSAGSDATHLVAWARPSDHVKIKEAVATLEEAGPPPEAKSYTLKSTDALTAIQLLTQIVPDALANPGSDPYQMVVWARPADHEKIVELIAEFDTEEAAAEAPTFVTYTLTKLTAANAMRIVSLAVPRAELTSGEDNYRFVARARPSDQALIVKTLAQVDVEGPDEAAAMIGVYTLGSGDSRRNYYTMRFLMTAVPGATFTLGFDPSQLIVWARPEEHKRVKTLIEQLDEEPAGDLAPVIETYSLENIEAQTAIQILNDIVPEAELSVGGDPSQLVVWARKSDQEKVKLAVEKFDEPGLAPEMKLYALEAGDALSVSQVLRTIVPDAICSVGATPLQLVAWARPDDHEVIQKVVAEMSAKGPPETEPVTNSYTLESITAIAAIPVLTQIVPDAVCTAGSDPHQLIVWARPLDHVRIREVVERLAEAGPPQITQTYTLKSIDAASAIIMLQSITPDALCNTGGDPYQLVVWARPADHDTIAEAILEIDKPLPPEEEPTFETYGVKEITAAAAMQMIQLVVPRAELSAGGDAYQFVAHARPEDQLKITATLEQIDIPGSEEHESRPVVYTLESGDIRSNVYKLRFLSTAFPSAQFTFGSDPTQLVVWAGPKDHEDIAILVEQLDQEPDEAKAAAMQTYTLRTLEATAATTMLRTVAPEAVCTVGSDPYQLLVFATPKDQAKIAAAIQEADKPLPMEEEPTFETYGVKEITAADAIGMLELVVPRAELSEGADQYQFVAHARPEDQEKIAAVLKQIDVPGSPEHESKPVVYTLESGDIRSNVYKLRFLATAFPDAEFTFGSDPTQLVAWAGPKDHEDIAILVEQLDQEPDEDKAAAMQTYTLRTLDATAATTMLATVAPEAVCTTGSDPYQLLVFATPKDQAKIAAAILEADKPLPMEEEPTFETYGVKEITAADAIGMLELVVPRAELSEGADLYQFVAHARPEDQEKIVAILLQIDVPGSPEHESKPIVYTLESGNATSNAYKLRFLQMAFPKAQFAAGADPTQIVAWAGPKDHEDIAILIEQLDQEPSDDKAPAMQTYTLKTLDATAATTMLATVAPEAVCTVGSDPYQLLVFATPKDQTKIAAAILEADKPLAPEEEPTFVTYTLDETTVTLAITMLQAVAPRAEFNAGETPGQMVVRARPEDHVKIVAAIEQIDVKGPDDATVEIYTLSSGSIGRNVYTIRFLNQAVPNAYLNLGADPSILIARASPKDHEEIATILAQMDEEPDAEKALSVVTYTLKTLDFPTATTMVARFAPEAVCVAGSDPYQLIVWATPKDHTKVATAIEEADKPLSPEEESTFVTYTLDETTVALAIQMLQSVTPRAEFNAGKTPGQMIVRARPEDHVKIVAAIEQIDVKGDDDAIVTVYTLPSGSINRNVYTIRFLNQAVPNAYFTIGADPAMLIARASPKDHAEIVTLLAQLDEEPDADKASTVVTYRLESTTSAAAIGVLSRIVPGAICTPGVDPQQLIVYATPYDHKKVATAVAEMSKKGPPGTERTMMVYTLEETTAASALTALQTAVPQAELSAGTDPRQVIAWATPGDHDVLAEAVKSLSEPEPEETAPKMVVYPLETVDSRAAIMFLQDVVPDAQFGAGANPRQLVAWARPQEHDKIKAAIEALAKQEPEETAPRVEVYTIESTDATTAIAVLEESVPEATFTLGSDPRKLIAFARPVEHEKIAAAIQQMEKEEAEAVKPSLMVYDLESAGAAAAIGALQEALPEVQFTVGDDPNKLIVWAYPEDHAIIEAAVEEIEADGWLAGNRVMSVYPMRREDAVTLMSLLDPVLQDHAQFVTDDARESLIVWADAKHHDAIKKTIDQYVAELPDSVDLVSKVYRFRQADPRAAYLVLRALVPEAQIAPDAVNRSLVVAALPEDHERIQATIDEMDMEGAVGSPELKIHRLTTANPTTLLGTLEDLFRLRPEVQLSLDENNDTIIAVATPSQHAKIIDLISQIEAGAMLDSASKLQLYPMKDIDTYSAMDILEDLFTKQGGKVDLSIDRNANQLVAIARPEQHEMIVGVLDQLRAEERQMEILELEFVDYDTASTAISNLFADEGYYTQPMTDYDPYTGNLFVRGTQEQMLAIRQLLIKMGEVNLSPTHGSQSGRLRVIPYQGDVDDLIEKLRAIWPDLAPGDVQVVAPDGTPAEDTESESQPEPADQPPTATPSETPTPEDVAAPRRAPRFPILIMPGDGTLTIASEDTDALDALESLLLSSSRTSVSSNRTYSIFQLENTSATAVATSLREMFQIGTRSGGDSSRSSRYSYNAPRGLRRSSTPLLIVPDERLNTILVQGSRVDRQTIEELLKMMDTSAAPLALAARQPTLIPIQHTDAERVEEIIRSAFRSQFGSSTSGGSSNAFTPQITVDEMTNSLLVIAPAPLLEEVKKLAETLDTAAAEDPSSQLKIYVLKNTNTQRVGEILSGMLRSSGGRGR